MHDHNEDADDNKYFPSELFRGFGGRKEQFILSSIKAGADADTVILSHINLLVVGWLIKKRYPAVKLVLFAHGIEIWEPFGSMRTRMLHTCDTFVSVSKFTSDKIQQVHGMPETKCKVLNNCLDPFLPAPNCSRNRNQLREQYGIQPGQPVLFTLSRLYSRERYKGYDKVLEAMRKVKINHPGILYLLAGSHDAEEKKWLDEMIGQWNLEDNVVITGYLQDEDLAPHFELADVYIMPSRKEGFGIVFIEAMYYGLPVIAGNADGSVDALLDGALGVLVNPDSVEDIEDAIENILTAKKAFIPNRELLIEKFSYETYKQKLADVFKD